MINIGTKELQEKECVSGGEGQRGGNWFTLVEVCDKHRTKELQEKECVSGGEGQRGGNWFTLVEVSDKHWDKGTAGERACQRR